MRQPVAVYNRSSAPLGFDLGEYAKALQAYADQYIEPVWGPRLAISPSSGPVAGAWGFVFMDNADAPGALAYHDEEGQPLAKVFVRTIQAAGESVTAAGSHELVEMAVDPRCNLYAFGLDPLVAIAFEAADPVQGASVQVEGFEMSDMVTPAWFDPTPQPPGTKVDLVGAVMRPFEVAHGGYVIQVRNGQVSNVFGSAERAARFAAEDRRGHRSERRLALLRAP